MTAVSGDATTALLTHFGLSTFRRGQREILDDVLASHDTLAVMPTGGGKSLCYQLPALARPGIVLVISPLISLMRDQVRGLQALAMPAGCLYAKQPIDEKREVFTRMRESESFLLYLSPERAQKAGFVDWFLTAPLSLIAIDEAHCVSQWGPDFREEYYQLHTLRMQRPEVPILALTATATPQVLRDIALQLKLREPKRHVYGFYRPNLYYQVESCDDGVDKLTMLTSALHQTPEGRVIVYAGTRKRCEELTDALSVRFERIDFYHAGMSADDRTRIQHGFDDGSIRILIATNAFGMGIDHPDVRLIVHYQMPGNIESYYQEMGRAGRDGEDSTCLLLYAKRDKGLHSYFITQSTASKAVINRRWRALETIVQFAEGGECRHAGILTYFKDTQRLEACGHCDVCAPHVARRIRVDPLLAPVRTQPTRPTRKRRTPARDTGPLSDAEQLRYELLREWRHAYATQRDIPAFIVFSNKTLHDLIKKSPQSLTELEHVYGLGPQKIEAFGAELLSQLVG
jgi:ATP-dependent DNA helicase RecQ